MKALTRQLHHHRHLLFLDLEGTQFSHEMIAFGAVKAVLNVDGSIQKTYKGIKRYVKPKNSIGSFVKKLTGITKEQLESEGITYGEALQAIKNYCGSMFDKTTFVTFGTHDVRIIMQSLLHTPEADETIAKHIVKQHLDLSSFLSQFIKDDQNNPLSLNNYLKVFELSFDGIMHNPLDDARNLVKLFKSCYKRQDIIFDQYLRVLTQMRHLPDPVLTIIKQLVNDEDVTASDFKKLIREYIE
jgi:inhibitor of KinA sporulation pathway (predicted exonuclease)